MTGRELVTASLRLFGGSAPGETIPAAEASDGLATLNRLLDSWSNEGLFVYENTREEFNLVAGTASYTIGSGGVFNTVRPIHILSALIKRSGSEYKLNQLSLEQWSSIQLKTTTSDIPTSIYCSGAYPLDLINLFPTPSQANILVLFTQKQLTSISTLDATVSLPPGYERALINNLAIELSPEYGVTPSQLVFKNAEESKAMIKRSNHKPVFLKVDNALVDRTTFNIYTGEYQ